MANPWLAATVSLALTVFVFAALSAGLLFVNRIGAGPFNGLLITANILFSLAIDHFGLLNMEVHALNLWRVLGGALMVAGIALIAIF